MKKLITMIMLLLTSVICLGQSKNNNQPLAIGQFRPSTGGILTPQINYDTIHQQIKRGVQVKKHSTKSSRIKKTTKIIKIVKANKSISGDQLNIVMEAYLAGYVQCQRDENNRLKHILNPTIVDSLSDVPLLLKCWYYVNDKHLK